MIVKRAKFCMFNYLACESDKSFVIVNVSWTCSFYKIIVFSIMWQIFKPEKIRGYFFYYPILKILQDSFANFVNQSDLVLITVYNCINLFAKFQARKNKGYRSAKSVNFFANWDKPHCYVYIFFPTWVWLEK